MLTLNELLISNTSFILFTQKTSEGFGTDIFIFDGGVHPSHSTWTGRNADFMVLGESRLQEPYICAGESSDWEFSNHGTHVTSIIGARNYGTARSANLHPIQVLGWNEQDNDITGSLATFLCGKLY